MSDTGAPWNLPFPLPTDLVRDGADAIKDLAEATATGLSAAGGLVAVQSVIKTDVFTESVAARPAISGAITGLSASITPTDPTHTLVVSGSLAVGMNDVHLFIPHLFRDGVETAYRGDAAGSRQRGFASLRADAGVIFAVPFLFAVTAGSTTATTFDLRLSHTSTAATTVFVNRAGGDDDGLFTARAVSSLFIQEVKV
jgi:hypothetical protein